MTVEYHTHFSPLADRFDAFIIDLWGVLHDGSHPYPGAVKCLTQLQKSGKEIILLSNAPRRAIKAEERLTELGFDRALYDHIITSGELTFRYICQEKTPDSHYFYIGPDKDQDLLNGSELHETADATRADFALVTGYDYFGQPFDAKLPPMQQALQAGLPLYCANPDRKVVRQSGETMLCAGLLAQWYAEKGGDVTWFGKPYPATYEACFSLLRTQNKRCIAAIGDSLHTDIAGANGAGISSIFCTGGIHAQEFGITAGELPKEAALTTLCEQENTSPTAIIPAFIW